MIRGDFHVHTSESADAEGTVAEAVVRARELGLGALGISEHADLEPSDPAFGFLDLHRYRRALDLGREEAGADLALLWGLEVDYQPQIEGSIRALLGRFEGDYTIGSVHYAGGLPMYAPERWGDRSLASVYAAYRDANLRLVDSGLFDVLGHLDFPRRYGVPARNGDRWREETWPFLEDVLRAVAGSGMRLGVNTGGLRKPLGEPSPSFELLAVFAELGGRYVVTGSDAHRPEDVGSHVHEVARRCEEVGLRVVLPRS